FDEFESVRNQILPVDPLPNINKAYYIVQQVEKQKQVTHQVNDPTTFFANFNNKNGQGSSSRREVRENRDENRGEKKVCGYCNQEGHLFEQYFERIGYLDWDTLFQIDYENEVTSVKMDLDQKLVNAVCQEMMKMIKGKGIDCSVNEASSSKPHAGIFLSGKDIQTGLSFYASTSF
ncbi:hypothetical protein Tco_1270349, partial [Tanacetum coccineum]